jgi:hypothetical protein
MTLHAAAVACELKALQHMQYASAAAAAAVAGVRFYGHAAAFG